jgi:hypothetical protein
METAMTRTSLIAFLLVGAAASAAPAIAKTSITKGHQICEEAAERQAPAPKSVRADRNKTTSGQETITVLLKVRNADDSSATLICKVDRGTGTPTLAPAS